ncbi:putative membrane protein [Clostridium acetobutylicum]|uniref:Predicted permease n=1 Tax=Clostridium acetobutylicum (strain ATCC 824 / DSM 792 / JCM 1419 / IAM 19013 / LMG 5710 / NBRC 13948 / NRRL B-527 / VKM B-1787 / 2291 / W) TaxID=272562 RepID=Q97HM6_CLOAB|nr:MULTISPECIES: DMT family transporter [Clostridium]AAK79944.1 Predicted permease [Clostridium acetobutylicum ATCC 824]ADZ21037.1 permease [Clostridium acetobutylicum EA 2018]AEI32114.1 permease [Clostridium acetobutylicum DSM 1731]AWV79624.1 EamA family transporter [Clostridium acetobutylicum]MBC2394403.1 DMT family transporter [Clostridium acetobutylicum]
MYSWIWMVILSGILLGFWDITKKKAFEKNSVLTVLAFYSFFAFLLVSFEFHNAINIKGDKLLIILIKTFIVFISWALSFSAIKKLPISVITPFDTLNPMFSVIFGIFILNEKLYLLQYIGIGIMLISYYFIGRVGSSEVINIFKNKYFYFMISAAVLNAVSATIDKIALKSINAGQMQFWFCFFMFLFNGLTMLYFRVSSKDKSKIKIDFYVPFMSLILIVSDRIYFTALNIPSSQISIVMPLRKISIIVSAVVGGIIFKEKNLKRKFGYICLLIFGIIFLFFKK